MWNLSSEFIQGYPTQMTRLKTEIVWNLLYSIHFISNVKYKSSCLQTKALQGWNKKLKRPENKYWVYLLWAMFLCFRFFWRKMYCRWMLFTNWCSLRISFLLFIHIWFLFPIEIHSWVMIVPFNFLQDIATSDTNYAFIFFRVV